MLSYCFSFIIILALPLPNQSPPLCNPTPCRRRLPRTGIVSLLSFHDRVGCFTSFLSHLQWLGMAAGKEQTNEHSPCAISDLCKIRFTSGGYNGYLSLCVYSLCFGVGVMAAKLRYICEMTKGMGKIFLKEVGVGKC